MNHRSVTVIIRAPAKQVFEYLSNIENLPEWAVEFCQELKHVDGHYKVVPCGPNPGVIFFRIQADARTGVIDMFGGPTQDALGLFPTRVVPLGDRLSAYTFTMFQPPGMPDPLFETQHASLQRELEHLRKLCEQ